ncbi:hypothetical protein BN1002_01398 [Bacillus sp. B-jedd]|nr:hypothetical protein BN1002_01398 [Bacillus sp. B-jedd]
MNTNVSIECWKVMNGASAKTAGIEIFIGNEKEQSPIWLAPF